MSNKKDYNIEELERGVYDIKNEDRYSYKVNKGLTEDTIRKISEKKNEPKWMLDFRLKSLETYRKTAMPTWGPSLDEQRRVLVKF